jgi:hypothetical protein
MNQLMSVRLVCSRHGRENIFAGSPEGERPLGGPGLDGRIELKWILEKRSGRILIQKRDQWQFLAIKPMNV